MYDDIAHNPSNPYPGVIINSVGGNNVYNGVPKDYTGPDVTPQNFIDVLTGNSTGGKKVLRSGPNDEVFIYFSDHGGPGMICFPYDVLYAHQLNDALKYMHKHKMYNSLVFYIEACESGSMFYGLLDPTMRIYAVTASTPEQSSYACCFDDHVGAYLGDVFSVNWLENSDNYENDVQETLIDQYRIVRNETNTSRVCMYGDISMLNFNLSTFIIYNNLTNRRATREISSFAISMIESNYASFGMFIRKYRITGDDKYLAAAYNQMVEHQTMQNIFGKISLQNTDRCYPKSFVDSRCMERRVNEFKQLFGELTDAKLPYLKVFGQDCIRNISESNPFDAENCGECDYNFGMCVFQIDSTCQCVKMFNDCLKGCNCTDPNYRELYREYCCMYGCSCCKH